MNCWAEPRPSIRYTRISVTEAKLLQYMDADLKMSKIMYFPSF